MQTNTKYMMAGGIVAAVGSIYALQRNIDSDTMSLTIEKYKSTFDELITELIELSIEFLERILKILKKLFMELIFKFKMLINI
ncbi:MAG: hypothetical protein ACK5HR_00470 [Mycoplasmatales bacterium]